MKIGAQVSAFCLEQNAWTKNKIIDAFFEAFIIDEH